MSERLIRLTEVKSRVGLGRSAIYAGIAKGSFPRPVKIGSRAVAWRETEISGWIEECVTTSADEASK